jgi:hypothetical protein
MKTVSQSGSIEKIAIYFIIFFILFFYLLPFLLFGTNAIITIHDNLDGYIAICKMYHDNSFFLRFNVPTKGFSEMSTLYYSVGFNFQNILHMFFSDFTAYVLSYCFSLCFGCISMYILLKKTLGFSSTISILTAFCYAVLPVAPLMNIAVCTLPLIITVFYYFAFRNNSTFSWKILFLLFYPVLSSFAMTGIFILGFWLLGLIILGIKGRRINPNLLVGFVLLCTGYILIDLRLFYVMFVLKTPLNRTIITGGRVFLRTLVSYCINGHYHAASFQKKIIVPLALIVSAFSLVTLIRRIKSRSGAMTARIKTAIAETGIYIKQLFVLEFTVFIFYLVAALHDSGLLDGFIAGHIPVLNGFNWGRVWIFNRVLWYVIFALCLKLISEISEVVKNINTGNRSGKIKLPSFLPRLFVWVLVCVQLSYISLIPVNYSDQVKTWFNEIAVKTGIAKKIMPGRNFDSFISYGEFFAEDLFEKIKKDIPYSGEKVAAFGYHPSVLMYNGFNCIDGYNSAYPLSYMKRFRTLIAPEFETNLKDRNYYDGWGGRMYLYNSELRYGPTRNKNTPPVKLNIDMEVFRNDFEGRYILSRAEISNNETLGLELIKRYDDDESIYAIYLYQAR